MSPMVDMPRRYVPPPLELVKGRIEELLPPDARQRIEGDRVLVIDTRDPDRFESGRLAGAVNLPSGRSARDAHADGYRLLVEETAGDRARPLVLYCAEGNRSARTVDALVNEHGFEDAVSIIGGIQLWSELGYPVDGEIATAADDAELSEGMEGARS
jgi:rhodanese-related sulfurtransferase